MTLAIERSPVTASTANAGAPLLMLPLVMKKNTCRDATSG
jgi:hypothetical protein